MQGEARANNGRLAPGAELVTGLCYNRHRTISHQKYQDLKHDPPVCDLQERRPICP